MRSDLCLICAPPYSALFCPLNTMTKQKTPLTPSLFSSFFFFFSVLFFFSPPVSPSFWNSSPEELLEVPLPPEFAISVKAAIGTIRRAIGFVSKFENDFSGDLRLSNAISDCLDLLDLSADELDWALSASQNRNGKRNSTGNLSSNLRTWISAAMVNQDTCADGFDGTNSFLKPLVTGSLSQAASLVRELLAMVPPNSAADGTKRDHGGKNSSPRKDRKLLEAGGEAADVTVALDGSGDYTRIADAVAAAPEHSTKRHVIYVKEGLYEENVEIKKTKWNLMIVGAGMNATVISGNRSFVDGWTTFRSATFAVSGRGFIGRDITIQNTAGPEKHQAVALRSDSDLSVYYRCAIKGYQDTLYTHTMRQFFRECRITGTVDFIFGDGSVVFQNCHILSRRALPDQKNTLTAQGRKDPSEPTGFVIQFCNISTDPPELNSTATFLGRPWKPYSRTVIMQSYMGGAIDAEGWLEWDADVSAPAPGTLYYGEYLNYGPGAGLESRVKWPGFHVVNDTAQVKNFTVARFIDGNVWLPTTGVKYTAGLEL